MVETALICTKLFAPVVFFESMICMKAGVVSPSNLMIRLFGTYHRGKIESCSLT